MVVKSISAYIFALFLFSNFVYGSSFIHEAKQEESPIEECRECLSREFLNAVRKSESHIVQYYLACGADVNYQDFDGYSALHFAYNNLDFNNGPFRESSNKKIMQLLKEYKINENLENNKGEIAGPWRDRNKTLLHEPLTQHNLYHNNLKHSQGTNAFSRLQAFIDEN